MFDPSKIDLDLDNLDKIDLNEEKNINKKNETINDNTEKIQEKIIEKEETKIEKKVEEKIEISSSEPKKEKIIFDINIDSIEYLIKYLISKEYDFFTLEPEDEKVKVSFRKDSIEREFKYIKYPIYNKILLKAKAMTNLIIEEISKAQEGKTEINFNKNIYKIISKTVPSNNGEKLFFKIVKTEKKPEKKKKEKMSIGKIIGIFSGLMFVTLIMAGIFFAIILFNSNSVEDLKFFHSLGIDANAIKDFAATLVNTIFGIILLVEIIFLFIFAYKALLTKKTYKQKKVQRTILSIFFLTIAAITFITWIYLGKKINSLRGANYGQIEYYDNSKLLSPLFDELGSKINVNERIIGPATIRFNIKKFTQKLQDDGFEIQKLIWKIGKDEGEIGIDDEFFIKEFTTKGIYPVNLIIEGKNLKGEEETKNQNIANINISNIIKINETKIDEGGSKFKFDATDLKKLGKVQWYYIPSLKGKTENEQNNIIAKSLNNQLLEDYIFYSKNIFDTEEYYGIKIVNSLNKDKNNGLDKLFILNIGNKNNISGEIKAIEDQENEKKYSFILKNPKTKVGKGYIKEFIWTIYDIDNSGDDKKIIIKKKANLSNLEDSSKINYTFKASGLHKINLMIIDSEGNKQNVGNKIIKISKKITIENPLKFFIDGKQLDYKKDIKYEKINNIYYLDDIKAPTKIKIDAIKIKAKNYKYALKDVFWDLDDNGTFETNEKVVEYDVNHDGIMSFKVKYIFQNRNINTEKINIIENINISSINKEAILKLDIIAPSTYVPVTIGFDASNSKVTGKDIDKFIFDYGDGTKPEERDSQNSGHKYIKAGDYTIKLKVVTTDGKSYTIQKKLVLRNKNQEAKIKVSLKRATPFQAIDFSAEDSIGEIANYYWDFGDGKSSTEISPSHAYTKKGKYTVTLVLETTNRNELKDQQIIEIYEE